MNTSVETLDKSRVSLSVEVGKEQVDKAINQAYNEMKGRFNIPGFRKGKVPRAMIEKMYGVEVFFENAADKIIDATLTDAIKDNDIDIVARLREGDLRVTELTQDCMKYVANIAIRPEITLGEYKNLTIQVDKAEVTDEEINTAIEQEAAKNAREIKVEDRAIQPQDKVTIDFKGFVDGEAFAGGEGADHPLVIGSKSFIPGFEDQLIGKNAGDEVEVNVTFPVEYHAESLAGKPAVFKVKINAIKVQKRPELNDEFAKSEGYDSVADLKEKLTVQVKEREEARVKNKFNGEVCIDIICHTSRK